MRLAVSLSFVVGGLCLVLGSQVAQAESRSPVGYWNTYGDDGKAAKSLVRITERNGKLQGRIIKLYPKANKDCTPLCTKCKGNKKNATVVGLNFVWGLKKDDDEWTGGAILDPQNGKQYRCKMELNDGGKKLKVRGFVGISLFGRTQIWRRAKAPDPKSLLQKVDGKYPVCK